MTVLPRTFGRPRTVLRLLPVFVRHLVCTPYRYVGRAPLGQRCRLAAYDTFLALLLAGMAELADRPVRDAAGGLAVLVNRIAFLLDDEFERRLGRRSIDFTEILETTPVGAAVQDMRAYLAAHCSERGEQVRDLLWQAVHDEYRRYAESALQRCAPATLPELLSDAELDSGAILRRLAEVIAVFDGFALSPDALAQFQALGVVCKLADDLRDWWRDEQAGAGNVLSLCLRGTPAELDAAVTAATQGERMSEARWRALCPHAYGSFCELYAERYASIRCTPLRLAADVMTETGRLGVTPDALGGSAARLGQGTSG